MDKLRAPTAAGARASQLVRPAGELRRFDTPQLIAGPSETYLKPLTSLRTPAAVRAETVPQPSGGARGLPNTGRPAARRNAAGQARKAGRPSLPALAWVLLVLAATGSILSLVNSTRLAESLAELESVSHGVQAPHAQPRVGELRRQYADPRSGDAHSNPSRPTAPPAEDRRPNRRWD